MDDDLNAPPHPMTHFTYDYLHPCYCLEKIQNPADSHMRFVYCA